MNFKSARHLAALVMYLALIGRAAAFADPASLTPDIDQILARPGFSYGIHACVIRTLDTGRTVYAKNPDTLLMPASNFKLLTSAAALSTLGPDFRYTTRLIAGSPIASSGTLHGNLTLVGSGDPILGIRALSDMVRDARAKGLKRVEGDVVTDTGDFDRTPYGGGWAWDYLSEYYAAPAGGVNLHKNVIFVTVKPGPKVGDPAEVILTPPSDYMRINNSVITSAPGSKKAVSITRDFGGGVVKVAGSIPLDAKVIGPEDAVAVLDPAQFTADVLSEMLKEAGVSVTGITRKGSAPAGGVQLGQYLSVPLKDILVLQNKWSDNLIAECLMRTMGAVLKHDGSVDAGRQILESFVKKAGLDPRGLRIADGSGLSRLDLITADNLVRILAYMYTSPNGKYFIDSLPVAGVDGTLGYRMKGTAAQGNVKAKTGYVGYVSSMSGYVTTAAGQPLAFCIIFNNQTGGIAPCRQAEDDICVLLAGIKDKL